jgi:hypothetical protein
VGGEGIVLNTCRRIYTNCALEPVTVSEKAGRASLEGKVYKLCIESRNDANVAHVTKKGTNKPTYSRGPVIARVKSQTDSG